MDVVVIDPGHGGSRTVGGSSPNNASGPKGLLEKNVTLDIARRLARLPGAQRHTVVLTRTEDVNVGLTDRAHVARDRRARVFVSIHFNGFNAKAQGTETFAHVGAGTGSLDLAKRVQRSVLAITGHPDRGVKREQFAVLKPASHHSATAACLVEISFMDLAQEEQRLGDAAYLDALAAALLQAIDEHLQAAASFAFAEMAEPLPEPGDGYEVIVR
ncbi:N-acetylmuramoyl-L-alanine amidase [Lysobacter sp. CA199]|uniref:N-acetylmuramoyl-L-alanine amidase n=1 Tax=Lysobacter sp. CA199 TaxID=3455608 RepID=UPI003F8D7F8E